MNLYSLRTKMGLAISGLVTILIVAMTLYAFSYFRAVYQTIITRQEVLLVDTMAKQIEDKLDLVQTALVLTSKSVTTDMVASPDKAQEFLASQSRLMTMFDNHIYIFSVTGTLVAEAPYETERRGMDFFYREYIQETLNTRQPVISTPYISSQSHKHPVVMLTAPVYGQQGNIIAIIAGGLDLMQDNFLGGLPAAKIGNTGYFYLFTTDRAMIIHPISDRILAQDMAVGSNKLFDQAIEGFDGAGETVSSTGVHLMATFKHLKNSNWILAANDSLDDVYAPFIQAEKFAVFFTPLLMLVVIVTVWCVVGKMTMPLVRLTKHVDSIPFKEGERRFSTILPKDEIGALSIAFNTMLSQLDKQTESLRASEDLYRMMTEFASDMVFWRRPDNSIAYISPSCERITGFCENDFYQSSQLLDEIVYEADYIKWLEYVRRTRNLNIEVLEFRIITFFGSIRWIHCVSRPMFKEDGEFCGLRGSYLDITDRKTAEEALQQVNDSLECKVETRTQELSAINQELMAMNGEHVAINEQLHNEIAQRERVGQELTAAIGDLRAMQVHLIQSEKMAALGKLVAGVAHEINTPVGVSITASSHLEQVTQQFLTLCKHGAPLRQDLVDYLENVEESSTIISKNLERAGKLIQSFKRVAVDQSSEVQRKFNVRTYLEEILLSMNPKIRKTKQYITIECDDDININTFSGAFAQVITNLVMNSLIHAYNPEEEGHIHIAVQKAERQMVVVYSDDGKGMEEDVVQRIFDPFFTTKRATGGSGLGLHIVYNIITQQFGGKIECESTIGKGSIFRIFLPMTFVG